MSDTSDNINNERKISVSFSRKISDGNYGTVDASAWVQGDASPDATAGEISVLLADLFAAASVAVFDQLGLTYEVDESAVVREVKQPTVQTAQAAVERSFGPTTSVPAGDLRVMNPAEQDGDLPDWLVRACAKDGVTGVWDNRQKAKGTKQPWFKEAVSRGATGHGKDGEPKAYWPPKSF